MDAAEQPTLRALLAPSRSGPAPRLPRGSTCPTGALDRPLRWVHSSDLADPTPFLAEDLALLTTGTQFDADADLDDVRRHGCRSRRARPRLRHRGASRRHPRRARRSRARRRGMPLFEVPYRTPFIAVARAHSEAIAAQAYARRSWALDTQRALALAALRPHGLDATVAELGRRLGVWVGMYDAAGALQLSHPRVCRCRRRPRPARRARHRGARARARGRAVADDRRRARSCSSRSDAAGTCAA